MVPETTQQSLSCHRSMIICKTSTDIGRWLSSESKKPEEEVKNDEWFSSESKKPDEDANQGAGSASTLESDTADAEEAVAASTDTEEEEVPKTREEILEMQVKDLKDQLLRSYAEQENTRKISTRDVESARQYAIKSFAKALLEVSDNLTRALEAVPEDMRKNNNGSETNSARAVLANLYEGIELTDRGLVKAFHANGLVRFGEVGETFDPNKHDALFEFPDPEKKPGTVGQVMKPGFMLHSRVLRPAEVGVVKEG